MLGGIRRLLSPERNAVPAESRADPPMFKASLENPNVPINQESLAVIIGGGPTMAGPHVNERSALRNVDVYRCVSILSGLVASLDLNVYEHADTGRKLAAGNRLYPLLHDAPNEFMSSFIWRQLMMVNLLLWGNHYSIIEYDGAGRIVDFVPVLPWQVEPYRKNGRIRYKIRLDDGFEDVDQDDMIHVPGMGFDGLRGLSVISAVGRQAIGTSLAMEEYVARMHSNSMRPAGIGTVKEGIDGSSFRRMKAQFDNAYSGVTNAGKTLWLDEGSTWVQTQLSPADSETLASRRHSTAQIANIFGVPAMLLNENADMTAWGAGIEQIMLGFQITTINPWLKLIEGEFHRKLFHGSRFRVEFDREGLIVMDAQAKAELFSQLVNSALMKPNEGRRKLNLPDDPAGDKLYIQGAMIPLDKAGANSGSGAQPAPPPAKPAPSDPRMPTP